MSTLIVRGEHLREAKRRYGGYCTRGVSHWFDSHGLSLREFLQHGYPVEVIEATQDTFGLRVAQVAREEQKGGA